MKENVCGKDVLKAFRQIQEMYSDISKMLIKVESELEAINWKSYSNRATLEGSKSIHRPRIWIPKMIFRYYTNGSKPKILASSFVCLPLASNKVIKEPIIASAIFDYDGNVEENWDWDYVDKIPFDKSETLDGRSQAMPVQEIATDSDIKRIEVRAYPLVSITNEEELMKTYIIPFQEDLKKF